MADEKKEEQTEEKDQTNEKPSFKNAEELTTFLMDLQGQMANMQETVDKLSPVEENVEEGDSEGKEETEEMSEEEVNEIDQLLQSE